MDQDNTSNNCSIDLTEESLFVPEHWGDVSPAPHTGRGDSVQTTVSHTPSGIDQTLFKAEAQAEQSLSGLEDLKQQRLPGNLGRTTVTIHFGKQLKKSNSYTVHLEPLRAFSSKLAGLFSDVRNLEIAYLKAKEIRHEVKALLGDEDSDNFTQDDATKAIEMILACEKTYPLAEHRHSVQNCLKTVVDEYFKNGKAWKVPGSINATKRRSMEDILSRLQVLNTDAIFFVTQRLSRFLSKTKNMDIAGCKTNPRKAAAHGQIMLPDSDETIVGKFVYWLYKRKLPHCSATDLCNMYHLANDLGVEILAEQCVDMLTNAALTVIENASVNGSSLRELLNEERPDTNANAPLANVFPTIFNYVMQDSKAPYVLQHLVVRTIAERADEEVYNFVEPRLTLGLSLQLNRALLVSRDVNSVKSEQAGLKQDDEVDEKMHTQMESTYTVQDDSNTVSG